MGEKHCACFRRTHSRGSPPRMRGKVVMWVLRKLPFGITPAHAGKSRPLSQLAFSTRDHPRACGEKKRTGSCPSVPIGSPPRMRGKVCGIPTTSPSSGITPAHAGKRETQHPRNRCYTDHPRACGEKPHYCYHCANYQGSPPRMRGKVTKSSSKSP